MSTLSLADLGPKMRRELGLHAPCACTGSSSRFVAKIPVVEVGRRPAGNLAGNELPGECWMKTGLHRLRIPASNRYRVPGSRYPATVTDS